jgi:hypothetical protein
MFYTTVHFLHKLTKYTVQFTYTFVIFIAFYTQLNMQESSAARLPQLSYGKAVFFEGSFMGVKLAIRIISYVL